MEWTPEKIRLHAEVGYKCGEARTCGTKRPFLSEIEANKAALAHNGWPKRNHDVEPYPCVFCGRWHIGRLMSIEELQIILSS